MCVFGGTRGLCLGALILVVYMYNTILQLDKTASHTMCTHVYIPRAHTHTHTCTHTTHTHVYIPHTCTHTHTHVYIPHKGILHPTPY